MRKLKKDIIRTNGIVLECLPSNKYRVDVKGRVVLAYLCGNMIRNHIRLMREDMVILELSIFDLNRGRIVFRK